MGLSVAAVTAQLRELGLREGALVEVHASFRALRPIEGGPAGLLGALRAAVGPTGTLVMPTMTDGAAVFDPATTPSCDMGALAEHFWRQPGVRRSGHPGGSFAAEGPLADWICGPQPLSPVHGVDSPPGRVWAAGGFVLLLGVHHSEDTLLHVAEDLAGVPYGLAHPCVVETAAGVETVEIWETDHCCMGFRQVSDWLGDRERVGPVGQGQGRLAAAADVVAVARAALARDPFVFLCAAGSGCEECDAARPT